MSSCKMLIVLPGYQTRICSPSFNRNPQY